MGRIRTVKPEFFRDEKLQDLECEHPALRPMLVFAGLWCQADKNGTFRWLPRTLKLDILPFVDFDINQTLDILAANGMIRLFTAEGRQYGQIINWKKHQRITGSEATDPPKFPAYSRGNNGETEGNHSGDQEGKGKEGNRKGKGEIPPEPFPQEAEGNHEGNSGETIGSIVPPGTIDLHPLQYATHLLEEIGSPVSRSNMMSVAQAIESIMRDGIPKFDAYRFLLARTKEDQANDIPIDRFYFEDAKWRRKGRPRDPELPAVCCAKCMDQGIVDRGVACDCPKGIEAAAAIEWNRKQKASATA